MPLPSAETACQRISQQGLFGADDRGALRRLERYRHSPPPPSAGPGAKMLAAITAQAWMYECGPASEVSELSLAALAGGELIAADNGLLANCPITNLTFADREEAEQWWEVARAEAHRRGSLLAISAISLWRGNTLHRRGELADAQESLQTAREQLDRWGYATGQAQIYCDAHLAVVLVNRGDLPAARTALERSHDPGGTDDGARYWLNAKTELLLAEGRYQQAAATADDYARRFSQLIRNPVDAPWRTHKALALAHLGRDDEGTELAEAELELARAWGAPGTVARTLCTLATLRRHDGMGHLEEAVALTAGTPARLEHAKALAALGGALRRVGQPAQARGPLRQALELASTCGAERLAGHARTELYAAGARPRSSAVTGPGSLTASERRVAAMAAGGRTNREVAEVLFVTPKTVEMHLGNIYRKLGIGTRNELPTALDDQRGSRHRSFALPARPKALSVAYQASESPAAAAAKKTARSPG